MEALVATRGFIYSYMKAARINILVWAAQYPMLALTLVIVISCLLLPFVSAIALMPFVVLLNIGNYLESIGLLSVVYTICFQGLLLAVLLIVLFGVFFTTATGANILYSKLYIPTKTRKKIDLEQRQPRNPNFALF